MFKKLKKNEKGFTLVELVVVIAILAILAALLVPRIMGNVEDAKKSKEQANARSIASEITTHNALAKVNSTQTIPPTLAPNHQVDATDLGLLGRPASDLPNVSIAKIIVDANGNATVQIVPTPTP